MQQTIKLLGLIGYPLEHSYSERFFNERFARLGYDFVEYRNFPLEQIEDLPQLLELFPEICGFNVTSPYKQSVMKYLTWFSEEASEVNAVNTVIVKREGESYGLYGYNTDIYGFEQSFLPELEPHHKKALILGTGGAAQAVAYVLRRNGLEYSFVSRGNFEGSNTFSYGDLDSKIMQEHQIIINATPIGMYPQVNLYPPLPYEYLGEGHLLFDLIYNPAETKFLALGKSQGAKTVNGLLMLEKQAEKAWEIFEQDNCFIPPVQDE